MSDKVRTALIELGPEGEPVTLAALAMELDMVSDKDKRPMRWALRDMCRTGEVERLEPGVVAYRGRNKGAPDIREAMWAVLRMRQSVTIADLQELADASLFYAREFMTMLVRRGCVESIRRKDHTRIYRLIKDTGPRTPRDNQKADKLRAIREAKKQAMAQLDRAGQSLLDATQAIARARMTVNDISEEAGHDE
jgi:hypothetical protein